MSAVASRRLIHAAAALPPVDRALLNLWVNRGLSDSELARMAGLRAEIVAKRRTAIVEALSAELGLPPAEIEAALITLAASGATQGAGTLSPGAPPAAPGGR